MPLFLSGDYLYPALLNPLHVTKLANQSISNNTIVPDTELLLPVAANAVYKWTAQLRYVAGGTAAVNGFKFGIYGPTGASSLWVGHSKIDSNGTDAAERIWMAALDITSTVSSGGAGGNHLLARPSGTLITGSTAGNFGIRWAQAVTNATGTVMLLSSDLTAHRVG